ncbi:MAG: response regulator transcription factor [Thermaerobacter sp.]|nr:response regulator transcription factor [Thermaerobacter sp.]
MSQSIRVMVVDDQALVCQGIRTILDLEDDMTVVATAGNGQEAVDKALMYAPDVILMDLNMPGLDGVESTRRILQHMPDCRIVILTVFDDDNHVFDGVLAGATGYLMKDVSTDELIQAVRAVARGEAMVTPKVAMKLLREFGRLKKGAGVPDDPGLEPVPTDVERDRLTNREWDILGCLASGMSNREIAEHLHIADGTVKNHICHIFDKLQLRDRTQAALFATRNWPRNRPRMTDRALGHRPRDLPVDVQ